jgi:hypothetical protein
MRGGDYIGQKLSAQKREDQNSHQCLLEDAPYEIHVRVCARLGLCGLCPVMRLKRCLQEKNSAFRHSRRPKCDGQGEVDSVLGIVSTAGERERESKYTAIPPGRRLRRDESIDAIRSWLR